MAGKFARAHRAWRAVLRVRISLWLYEGRAPSRNHEVTVHSFSFTPYER